MAGAVRARTALAVLVALASAGAEHAFSITSLSVPEYVDPARDAAGAGVELECTYDGDFTVLKWWKGRQEFFRYTPGAAPSTRTFPALGVGSVRALACGPTACRLRLEELTEEASGAYRCDIERVRPPPFRVATRTAHMRVRGLAASARRPALSGLRDQYGAGEEIRARCDGAPDSHLRWYVNGQEAARGSPELRLEATRLLFLGARAEAAVQCAEFSGGRLIGSSTAKARWRDARAPAVVGAANAESGPHPQPEEQRTGGASASASGGARVAAAALAVISLGVMWLVRWM